MGSIPLGSFSIFQCICMYLYVYCTVRQIKLSGLVAQLVKEPIQEIMGHWFDPPRFLFHFPMHLYVQLYMVEGEGEYRRGRRGGWGGGRPAAASCRVVRIHYARVHNVFLRPCSTPPIVPLTLNHLHTDILENGIGTLGDRIHDP